MALDKQTYLASITPTSLQLFFAIFILTSSVVSGLMMTFYHLESKTLLEKLIEQERFAINLQSFAISDIFDTITSDLLLLSQLNELEEYLANGEAVLLDKIAAECLIISKQKRIYDQIRFLDSVGMEIIRVNYNNGSPIQVSPQELQSKQKRYYFNDSFKKNKGKIFISPFDLNFEHGKIELPFKPMIRLGTPVFDGANMKRGIVIINYCGKDLLDKILALESVSIGKTMLLNQDGYWLLSPRPSQEWGFMFSDDQQTLAVSDQAAWNEIDNSDHGQIKTSKGIYSFKTVYPVSKNKYHSRSESTESLRKDIVGIDRETYSWHLVSFLSSEEIASAVKPLLIKLFYIGAGLFFLIASGSWLIAAGIRKRRIYQTQLQTMAFYDPLTKLPNRSLFFDRLEMVAEHSRRYDSRFGLLYIDLDGFKQVNDTMGHIAGDELLKVVADTLLAICRKSDTVARLGGDEFAIIFTDIESSPTLETVVVRIIASFLTPIELTSGPATIGASIGVAFFPTDSDNIEELVHLADKSMYVSKHQGKNSYTLDGKTIKIGEIVNTGTTTQHFEKISDIESYA